MDVSDDGSGAFLERFERVCEEFRRVETREQAEKYLVDFRKSKGAIAASIGILQRSENAFARFQAVCVVRDVTLAKWNVISAAQRGNIRNTIWSFVKTTGGEKGIVAKQLMQTVAAMTKRAWSEMSGDDRDRVFVEIDTLLRSETTSRLGNAFLKILVGEFLTSRGGSTTMGLKLEWHRRTRTCFENHGLQQCLRLTLGQIERAKSWQDRSRADAYATFFTVLSEVLSFDFGGENPRERGNAERVCPGPRWRKTLLGGRGGLVRTIFQLYHQLRNGQEGRVPHLMHLCRESLIGLASLHGDIFISDRHRIDFFGAIFADTIAVFERPLRADPVLVGDEVIDLSRLLRRAVTAMGFRLLLHMNNARILLKKIEEITCHLMRQAVSQTTSSNTWFCEAFDSCLDIWAHLILDPSVATDERRRGNARVTVDVVTVLQQHCANIFVAFISCQTRMVCAAAARDDDYDEMFISPTSMEQMDVAVSIGRFAASSSTSQMGRLLVDALKAVRTPGRSAFVRLRWAVRAASRLLADVADGEDPMIPTAFADEVASRKAVELVSVIINVIKTDLQTILRTQQIQRTKLTTTLLKCAHRISATYLMVDAAIDLYDNGTAPCVVDAFGRQSQGGHAAVSIFVRYSALALANGSMHAPLSLAAAEMLFSLSKSPGTCAFVPTTAEWSALVDARAGRTTRVGPSATLSKLSRLPRSPREVPRILTEALCRGASYVDKDCNHKRVTDPLEGRLARIARVTRDDIARNAGAVLEEFELVMSSLRGVILATSPATRDLVEGVLTRVDATVLGIVQTIHAVRTGVDMRRRSLQAALAFFVDVAEALLPYLSKDNLVVRCCNMSIAYIQCFAAFHRPRLVDTSVRRTDGELVSSIVRLSQLVASASLDREIDEVHDLVLKTLSIVLPIATWEDMQIPEVQRELFALIREMCESTRGASRMVSGGSIDALCACLLFGTEHNDSEALVDAYRSIRAIGVYRLRIKKGEIIDTCLNRFLRRILDLASRNRLPEGTALDAASNALLILIALGRGPYRTMVQCFLGEQKREPETGVRMRAAFEGLTSGIDLSVRSVWSSRPNRTRFLKNLKLFMFRMQGLLDVK